MEKWIKKNKNIEKNTELMRTNTNSGSVSLHQFVRVSYLFLRHFIIFMYEKTTEITEDTENDNNSVISVYSVYSVVDIPYPDYLSGGIKKYREAI